MFNSKIDMTGYHSGAAEDLSLMACDAVSLSE